MLRNFLGRTYAAVMSFIHVAVVLAGGLFLLGTFGETWPRNLYCFLISISIFGGWFFVFPWFGQFLLDIPVRRALRVSPCPECGAIFEGRAARRAKHVVLTKLLGEQLQVGDPPPDEFTAVIAEGWLVDCGSCRRTLQLVRTDDGRFELFAPSPAG